MAPSAPPMAGQMIAATVRCVAFMSLVRRMRMVRRIEEASRTSRTAVARMANPVTWSEPSPEWVRVDQAATTTPSATASRMPRPIRPYTTPHSGTAGFQRWWFGV